MIRSVCTAFVNAPLFRKRTPEAQLLWFKLYMHPAQHLCGLFVLDLGGMAHCTALDMSRTGAAFGELLQTGLCEADNAQDLVWLPEMSNQCKSMTKAKGTVYTAVDKYINSLGKSPLCLRVCDTLGIPYRYPIDTLLSGSVSGIGSDSESGSGNIFPTRGASDMPAAALPEGPPLAPGGPSRVTGKARHTATAIALLGELSAARKRCKPGCEDLQPLPCNLRELTGRLADGHTPEEIRGVIGYLEASVKAGTYDMNYFTPVNPFRQRNFGGHSGKTAADVKQPLFGARAWPPARAPAPDVDQSDDVLTRFEKGPRR